MKCPHCGTGIYLETENYTFVQGDGSRFNPAVDIEVGFCPACEQPIVTMTSGEYGGEDINNTPILYNSKNVRIFPQHEQPTVLSDAIPSQYAEIFHESECVNNISPRASATLSRYLLQMLLHEELHIEKRNLEQELDEFQEKKDVSSQLITMLHIMRRVANFGAHPKKSTNSKEIIEVEKGESDIMLELLKELFDYLFVKPKQQEEFLKTIQEKYGIQP